MKRILLIDKPKDWTSFDVVAKVRNSLRQTKNQEPITKNKIKVGHAGTLDPFATGLLIVLLGEATKEQDRFMKLNKEYIASLRLGATSSTGDPEGNISPSHPEGAKRVEGSLHFSRDDIEKILKKFIGEIEQIPPIHSAIKVNGKRAYALAREGKTVELKPRTITIHKLEILNYKFPELKILVKCSSGTYIRTLAEDIGKELGTGAYLTELRRTKIGDYKIEDAISVEEAINKLKSAVVPHHND